MASEEYAGKLPHKTKSLCPECSRILDAEVFEEKGNVFISRECPEHGEIKELYWEDAGYYNRGRKFAADGKTIENPNVGKDDAMDGANCPYDCGLCGRHKNFTALGNLVVTNRCDLSCWYCFFFAKEGDPIYEPSLAQIRKMLRNLRKEKPIASNAIQLTGGEPTLREDLTEIIRVAKEEGFDHVQLNTDGINLAFKEGLVKKVRKAGVNTLYLSFDGTTPKTNPKNHWEVPFVFENCRKANMGAVLVPTVIKGINDHDLGNILNFGLNHLDIVRAVNFQPVSLVGRMPRKEREKRRITIPGTLKKIEEQTRGLIAMEDFYVIPCITPFTDFVEAFTGKPKYDLSTHFACGAATYIYMDGKTPTPITRFIDFEGLREFLSEKTRELKEGKHKAWVGSKMLFKIGSFLDKEKQPKGLNLANILFNTIVKHNYRAIGELHHKTMFAGLMHFQDKYNYDVERVERCDIHYVMPDGRIIPFCAFNVIPEIYRDKVQAQYSIPQEEWSKKTGKTLLEGKYRRKTKELESSPVYGKIYDTVNYFE